MALTGGVKYRLASFDLLLAAELELRAPGGYFIQELVRNVGVSLARIEKKGSSSVKDQMIHLPYGRQSRSSGAIEKEGEKWREPKQRRRVLFPEAQ